MYPSAYFSSLPFPGNSFTSPPTNQTNNYCKILSHNTNATNFCQQKPCYMVNANSPWIKKRVEWHDNAAFAINNRIVSNTNYFGGEYNRLHYSHYTPFHYDPTWQDYRIVQRRL